MEWYKSWGNWALIQLGVLGILGVLGNWFDWAGVAGGFMLVCITIPYIIIMAIVHTIKRKR